MEGQVERPSVWAVLGLHSDAPLSGRMLAVGAIAAAVVGSSCALAMFMQRRSAFAKTPEGMLSRCTEEEKSTYGPIIAALTAPISVSLADSEYDAGSEMFSEKMNAISSVRNAFADGRQEETVVDELLRTGTYAALLQLFLSIDPAPPKSPAEDGSQTDRPVYHPTDALIIQVVGALRHPALHRQSIRDMLCERDVLRQVLRLFESDVSRTARIELACLLSLCMRKTDGYSDAQPVIKLVEEGGDVLLLSHLQDIIVPEVPVDERGFLFFWMSLVLMICRPRHPPILKLIREGAVDYIMSQFAHFDNMEAPDASDREAQLMLVMLACKLCDYMPTAESYKKVFNREIATFIIKNSRQLRESSDWSHLVDHLDLVSAGLLADKLPEFRIYNTRFQDFFVEELEVEIADIRQVLTGLDEVVSCLQIELMASHAVRLLQALCNSNVRVTRQLKQHKEGQVLLKDYADRGLTAAADLLLTCPSSMVISKSHRYECSLRSYRESMPCVRGHRKAGQGQAQNCDKDEVIKIEASLSEQYRRTGK